MAHLSPTPGGLPATASPQVAVLDFGGQYANLIVKRIKQLGVNCVRLPGPTPAAELEARGFRGLIASGGPASVYAEGAPQIDPAILEGPWPYLGICYGMQLLAKWKGGRVERQATREDGRSRIDLRTHAGLFAGWEDSEIVWMSHGDTVAEPPPGFTVMAVSDHGLIAALAHEERPLFGVQFHPEVHDTPKGTQLLSNFVFQLCGCEANYSLEDRVATAIAYIRERVGQNNVLILLSGGVDSAVAAALCLKALPPEQVYAIHVDHGFMREKESETIVERMKGLGFHPGHLRLVRAGRTFYHASTILNRLVELAEPPALVLIPHAHEIRPGLYEIPDRRTLPLHQVIRPQEKRAIIGDTFIRVTREQMAELGLTMDQTFLVQGTLFTDLIESGSGAVSAGAAQIKLHHNVSRLVMDFRRADRLLEPNAELYKDDVRQVARQIGLGEELARRRPFPGPGMAIRVICADGPERGAELAAVRRRVREVVAEESEGQLQGHLVPIRTVGVQGDERTYSFLALLTGPDLPREEAATWERVRDVATNLTKRVSGEGGVNRVTFLIGPEEVEEDAASRILPTRLNHAMIHLIRRVHALGEALLEEYDPQQRVAQMPFVLFPADLTGTGQRSVAIRGLMTSDFMTGTAVLPVLHLPWEFFARCRDEFLRLDGVGAVVIDVTSKPPATTCWE